YAEAIGFGGVEIDAAFIENRVSRNVHSSAADSPKFPIPRNVESIVFLQIHLQRSCRKPVAVFRNVRECSRLKPIRNDASFICLKKPSDSFSAAREFQK